MDNQCINYPDMYSCFSKKCKAKRCVEARHLHSYICANVALARKEEEQYHEMARAIIKNYDEMYNPFHQQDKKLCASDV